MEQFIEDSSLQDWKVIGSGGFGQIYKARHRQWACDVAIKLLRYDDGTNASLLREIKRMQEEVICVLGVFKGLPPNTKSGFSAQLGVVMELMERGSLASLQEALDGPPPWPLVFRLAHQVAQGINFLHSLPRPVLHLDLKPPNVLLDDSLNVKPTLVELLIPLGQRPLLDDIKGDALGLAELTGLMQRCWDNKPEQRPRALECTTETEQLYKMHKDAIVDAVYEVLKKLDQKAKEKVMTEQVQRDQIAESSGLYYLYCILYIQLLPVSRPLNLTTPPSKL
ncbi:hypothetical protein EPR50_G00031600 [Perca flavescens]|uniref:Protein kinase domain-containing protein n=1 Tax=Perca flavescens TaxID=8167 RepID=A0A484DJM3_PERFV|nr:hypothetical protein EPR50_G00031600 [Perca flavescens]